MREMIKPTLRAAFKRSIPQNSGSHPSDKELNKKEMSILSNVRLAVLKGYPIYYEDSGKVRFELGAGHWKNSYIAQHSLPVIKSGLAVIAQESGIEDFRIQGITVVIQPGIFRNKVIAHLPSEQFMDQMIKGAKGPKSAQEKMDSVFVQEISPQVS